MSYNGSGTFSIGTAGNPVQDGTRISPEAFNATMDEIADGLTACITADGQTTITQNIPFNSKRITGLGDAVLLTDAISVKGVINNIGKYVGTVGGTVDAITLTPSPAITDYQAGQELVFIASGANTGAVTVNVNSLGAKAITKNGTTALSAGDLPSGAIIRMVYDGTRFQVRV